MFVCLDAEREEGKYLSFDDLMAAESSTPEYNGKN
jgi:hypothetical protein